NNHFHLVLETPRGLAQERTASPELDHRRTTRATQERPRKKSRSPRGLRRETTTTFEWIANRLRMGAATHVASLLHRENQKSQNTEETLFPPLGWNSTRRPSLCSSAAC